MFRFYLSIYLKFREVTKSPTNHSTVKTRANSPCQSFLRKYKGVAIRKSNARTRDKKWVASYYLAGQDARTTSKPHPIHKDRVAIKTSVLMIKTQRGTETWKVQERREVRWTTVWKLLDSQICHNQVKNCLHSVPPIESLYPAGKFKASKQTAW